MNETEAAEYIRHIYFLDFTATLILSTIIVFMLNQRK